MMMEYGLEVEAFSAEGGDCLQRVGGALPILRRSSRRCRRRRRSRRLPRRLGVVSPAMDDFGDIEISEQRGNALNPLKHGVEPSFLSQGQGHIGGGRRQISLRQLGAQLVWFGGEKTVRADFRTFVSGRGDSVQHLGKGEPAGLAVAEGKDVPTDRCAAYLYVQHELSRGGFSAGAREPTFGWTGARGCMD